MVLLGDIIIGLGTLCILIGIIGFVKYKSFYTRILVTTKIETVGVITIIIGVAVRHGLSFFSLKVLLLMIMMIIINPLVSHVIARCAYLTGYKADGKIKDNNPYENSEEN
ncbi:MAG: monovalent cation/H(+) antiporter subunit G [Defluviitaleaceae bacterium]|nr:monovalent cation/H(+) antiporter subunit G [Defluviitaleaceae bacterium]